MLTKEKLEQMQPGEIIAVGIVPNSPEGIFMTEHRKGDNLLWIAKRGDGYPDWAIYCHFLHESRAIEVDSRGITTITALMDGEKITGGRDVQRLVPCDDSALQMYRS